MDKYSVDVVILTYKPDEKFIRLINMLKKQTVLPENIIIVNTGEKFFSISADFSKACEDLEVHHITEGSFDHGESRNYGASLSNSEYIIFMTQDAVPDDTRLVEELLGPMASPEVAVSYARQLPASDAGAIERFNRSFNYPDGDRLKTDADFEKLGIKTIFCSDVCACYRRSAFDSLGGFVRTDFNEDMIFAFHALKAGYGIYYSSKARVIHSHEYTAFQQFKRNIALGASQGEHPEVFGNLRSEGEGKRLVKECIAYLIRIRKPYLIPVFVIHCAARYAGFLVGKSGAVRRRKT